MLTLAVVATRGGIGKTAAAANLGGLLRDLGRRVLFFDAHVHPSLTPCSKASGEAQDNSALLAVTTTNKSAVAPRDAATVRGPVCLHVPLRTGYLIRQQLWALMRSLGGKLAPNDSDLQADAGATGLVSGTSTVPSF